MRFGEAVLNDMFDIDNCISIKFGLIEKGALTLDQIRDEVISRRTDETRLPLKPENKLIPPLLSPLPPHS